LKLDGYNVIEFDVKFKIPQNTDEPRKYCTQGENKGNRGNIWVELLLMNTIDKTKKDTSFLKMFAFITKISENNGCFKKTEFEIYVFVEQYMESETKLLFNTDRREAFAYKLS